MLTVENVDRFKKLMKADSNINMDTPWSYVEQEFFLKRKPQIMKEGDQILFDQTPSDLLIAFEEFIKDLEREDFQQKKQERRRIERKNRERFVTLLKALFDRRLINHRTKWRDLVRGSSEEAKKGEITEKPELPAFGTMTEVT